MKILFTSVGRRVELLQAFKNAAQKLGEKLCIIGTDISDTAPALKFCDYGRITCKIADPEYIDQLLNICREESVECLIPTIDTDLLILSKNKKFFEEIGTKVLVSSYEKNKICRDKNCTAAYFHSLGLKSPATVNNVEKYCYGYPAFIKPKDGSSSIHAYKADNLHDLKYYEKNINEYIIQPFIAGDEYTVDVFCDYEGNPIFITPRKRLAVRGGEVLKAEICQDDKIIAEVKQLIADYKPCGQITVQLIREENTGDDYYIEINPRFGGGAPLSIKAGADSAEAVLRLLQGEILSYVEKAAEHGAIFSRYDESVRVK